MADHEKYYLGFIEIENDTMSDFCAWDEEELQECIKHTMGIKGMLKFTVTVADRFNEDIRKAHCKGCYRGDNWIQSNKPSTPARFTCVSCAYR